MKRILVTGAGGFIGRNVVQELLEQGYAVVAFDFNPRTQDFFKEKENCFFMTGDIRRFEDVDKACAGAGAVIHLAGAIRISDFQSNYDIHVRGAENLVSACRKQGVNRIIAYSSIAAAKENPGYYGLTKKQLENVFLSSGMEATLFRPTMVIGRESIGLKTIVNQIKAYPFFIPLVGSGNCLKQPVWVTDITKLTVAALWNRNSYGNIYDLGGGESLPFRELVDNIKKELGIRKILLPIPAFIPKLAARTLELVFKHPPFTYENVQNLTTNDLADIEPARKDLGFMPTSLTKVLPEVMRSFQ